MKVVHVTPTYFDEASIVGGGERYPTELATQMAEVVDTTLVSFSSERRFHRQGNLTINYYPVHKFIRGIKGNPLAFQYLMSVLKADVVHIHCIYTLVSDMACLAGYGTGKRVFITDHGGGGDVVLNSKLPVFSCYCNAIAQSEFAAAELPESLQKKSVLIKGGINMARFSPDLASPKENKILYVGRLLPHKGVNYLIEAFRLLNRPDYKLVILGKAYSDRFYSDIQALAEGLPVEFVHDADDRRLLHEYRTAKVTVLPSVLTTCYGEEATAPELMGFTLLESQACGTPVICTNAAMHEFVEHGHTGMVVAQNSGAAIASDLKHIVDLPPAIYAQWQARCQEWVKPLSWPNVVQQHLNLYQGNYSFSTQ